MAVIDYPFQGSTTVQARAVCLYLSGADFTPQATGRDLGSVKRVPYNPFSPNPLVSVQFTVVDIFARVEAASTLGAITLTIERYTGTGAFSLTNNLNSTPISIAQGLNEITTEPPVIDLPTVNSGDKLACNWNAIGTNAQGFEAYVMLVGTF